MSLDHPHNYLHWISKRNIKENWKREDHLLKNKKKKKLLICWGFLNWKKMVSFPYLFTLLVTIQLSLFGSNSLVLGLRKICSLCNGPSGDLKSHRAERLSGEEITSMLALDEPCGVYTLPCAQGLRCFPPLGDQSPLQALLQGRGVCKNIKSTITDIPPPTGKMAYVFLNGFCLV